MISTIVFFLDSNNRFHFYEKTESSLSGRIRKILHLFSAATNAVASFTSKQTVANDILPWLEYPHVRFSIQ